MLKIIKKLNDYQLLFLCIVINTLLHIPLSLLPLGRDQGVWSTIGQAFASGHIFIKDFLHFNLPGLGVSFYLASFISTDPRIQTAIISAVGISILITAAFYLLKRLVTKDVAITYSLALSILFPIVIDWGNISQKDFVSSAFIFLAASLIMYADIGKSYRYLLLFIAGLSVALASMHKPLFAIIGLLFAIVETIRHIKLSDKFSISKYVLSGLCLLLGFVSIFSVLVVSLYNNDVLAEARFALIEFTRWYAVSKDPSLLKMTGFLWLWSSWASDNYLILSLIQMFLWTPLIGYGAYLYYKHYRSFDSLWFLCLIITALFTFYIQSKGFPYHAFPWVFISLIFVSISLNYAFNKQDKPWLNYIIISIFIFVLIRNTVFSNYFTQLLPYYVNQSESTRIQYLMENFHKTDGPHPINTEALAKWIDKETEATERIVVWGIEDAIYALSNRRAFDRHHFSLFLSENIEQPKSLVKWQEILRSNYLHEFDKNPPSLFIINNLNPKGFMLENTTVKNVPGLLEHIEENYERLDVVDDLTVYKRKQ